MPIGILANAFSIFIGGLPGMKLGLKFSESFKANLNTTFGVCAMAMGISSIVLMKNMPAVILSVILGTVFGLAVHMGERISAGAMWMERGISKLTGAGAKKQAEDYQSVLVTCIVLFCASGTGIYGSMVSGMTGDHSILLAKTVLDLPTAMIADFKACGGILLLATGFRMIKVKEFPVAEMIPAMVLVMPISYVWTAFAAPLLG